MRRMSKSAQRGVCAGLAAALLLFATAVAHGQNASTTALPEIDIIAASPLIGSGIDRNTVPAATNVLNSDDIKRQGTPDLTRALQQQVGGVSLDSAAGNPF